MGKRKAEKGEKAGKGREEGEKKEKRERTVTINVSKLMDIFIHLSQPASRPEIWKEIAADRSFSK